MSLYTATQPSQDLELYLGYNRPAARYADYADIRHRLTGVAPAFDFDRAMTNPDAQVICVRDGARVRGMAVLSRNEGGKPVFHLYYAEDAATTQALMRSVEEALSHDQFIAHA